MNLILELPQFIRFHGSTNPPHHSPAKYYANPAYPSARHAQPLPRDSDTITTLKKNLYHPKNDTTSTLHLP